MLLWECDVYSRTGSREGQKEQFRNHLQIKKNSALFQPLYHCNSAIKLCHKLLCKALRLYKKYIFSNNIRINLQKSLLAQISADFLTVTDLVRSQNYSLYASKVNYC